MCLLTGHVQDLFSWLDVSISVRAKALPGSPQQAHTDQTTVDGRRSGAPESAEEAP